MLRSFKTILGAGILALTALSAGAYSLLGPYEDYQTATLGYQQPFDLGGPKNLAEEYRWNVPVLYYSIDQTFLDYFGSNGVAQIQAAFDVFNAIPPVSQMSTNLSEFPLESTRVNYRAQATHLFDLKSMTLMSIMQASGLAFPDRFTWCLRGRNPMPGLPCPNFEYTVIKRNFDPLTQNYSSYVNGTLYTYHIEENCNNPNPPGFLADAIEDLVDPLAFKNTAVAAFTVAQGNYLTGFTRDDMGGWRYLLSPTSLPNTEPVVPGVVQIATNSNTELLITSNLVDLANAALTNDAPTLQALYPGLVITGTTNYFTNLFTTNYTYYYTNSGILFGVTNKLVTVITLTPYTATNYLHSFGNVVTNHFYPSYSAIQQTVMLTNFSNEPVGTPPHTNTINTPYIVNQPSGDFFLVPQGTTNGCGLAILSTQMTNVITITNASSIPPPPPPPGTNDVSRLLGQTNFTIFTNYTLVVKLVTCPDGRDALRRGIDKVTFVRRDFDSLLGQFFDPVTNIFTYHEVVNNTEVVRTYRRIVTQPDFLIMARDISPFPSQPPPNAPIETKRFPAFFDSSTNAYPGLAGPGILRPGGLQMFFNKVGPFLQNTGPASITENTASLGWLWGSFDGTTNEPVVYPSTTSLEALNDQLILRVTNPAVPAGNVGVSFSYTIQGAGGQPPYTWTIVPDQFGLPSGLPTGLTLQPSGLITGTPTAGGTYNFVVRMTDAASRFIEQPLTITVNP